LKETIKILFILFLLFFISKSNSFSQTKEFEFDSIPKNIDANTKADVHAFCSWFVGQQEFTFNFNTEDLRNSKKKSEINKQENNFSQKNVDELKALLKGDYTDAELTYEIALKYSELQNEQAMNEFFSLTMSNCEKGINENPDSLKYYLIAGKLYSSYNQHQELIELFKTPLSKKLKDESIYLLPIMSYINLKDFANAKLLCKQAIEIIPENESFYFYLVLVEVFELFNEEEDFEKFLEGKKKEDVFSLAIFEDAVKKYPQNRILELSFNMTKQYLLSISVMSKITEIKNIGVSQDKEFLKETSELMKYYQKVLKTPDLNNKYSVYYAMGALEVLTRNFENAVKYTKSAIENRNLYAPTNTSGFSDIYNNLSAIYILKGDTALSITTLKEKYAITSEINDLNKILSVYINKKDFVNAYLLLDKALTEGTYDVNTLKGYCIYRLYINDLNEANKVLTTIFEYFPNDIEARVLLGLLMYYNEDYSKAYQTLKEVYEQDPNFSKLNEICEILFKKK